MNVANVKKAIAIMERAKEHNSVDMRDWQSGSLISGRVTSEKEFHACGNKACFAGHIAISPEFQAAGGLCTMIGTPSFRHYYGSGAVDEWLGISVELAHSLVFGDTEDTDEGVGFSTFYNRLWKNVTADDVLAKLHLILAGELS